jgi:hypothetical protein
MGNEAFHHITKACSVHELVVLLLILVGFTQSAKQVGAILSTDIRALYYVLTDATKCKA